MNITFSVDSAELNDKFIKMVKELFEGKKITITVSEEVDETEYLLKNQANKNRLTKAIEEYEKGEIVTLTMNDLEEKYLKS